MTMAAVQTITRGGPHTTTVAYFSVMHHPEWSILLSLFSSFSSCALHIAFKNTLKHQRKQAKNNRKQDKVPTRDTKYNVLGQA